MQMSDQLESHLTFKIALLGSSKEFFSNQTIFFPKVHTNLFEESNELNLCWLGQRPNHWTSKGRDQWTELVLIRPETQPLYQ